MLPAHSTSDYFRCYIDIYISNRVTVIGDVNAVAEKIVALKSIFPKANAFNILSKTPKLLLKSTEQVLQDAELVS